MGVIKYTEIYGEMIGKSVVKQPNKRNKRIRNGIDN